MQFLTSRAKANQIWNTGVGSPQNTDNGGFMHNVTEWKYPKDYCGAEWHGWYSAGFGQSRDSDALEASNFQSAYDALKPLANVMSVETQDIPNALDDECSVQIVRESHWAVGWVEWIAIHSSNLPALEKARELCKRANDYPVLDEEDFSNRESEECERVWRDCFDAGERVNYLRRHSYTTSSFADLLQAVRAGSWYHAANMLHCPSDLLY
jgi:hypothetical protein